MNCEKPNCSNTGEIKSPRDKRKEYLRTMTQVPIFAVLMVISARIGISGAPIPVTLQLPMAILTGLLIGPWKGVMAQGLYLLMGLIGLPVFSSGGGISYIFMPSFGFLLGFPVSAFCAGLFSRLMTGKSKSSAGVYAALVLSSIAAICACYLTGAGYMYLFGSFFSGEAVRRMTLREVMAAAVLPFLWKDLIMMLPVAFIAGRLRKLRVLGS